MVRLAASLSMLFAELPFEERFAAAARAGFRGVEIQFPYALAAPEETRRLLEKAGLDCVLINAPCGDWERGERGFAALPGCEARFRESLERGLAYARAIDAPRLHAMAGVAPEGATRHACEEVFCANLASACRAAAGDGITILIEPLNAHDFPGYVLARPDQALEVIAAVGAPNLALQLDVYHCARAGIPVLSALEAAIGHVGHVQVAGVPERAEPDRGTLDPHPLLAALDRLGYRGWVGLEYRPRGPTLAGLAWARAYGIGGGAGGT